MPGCCRSEHYSHCCHSLGRSALMKYMWAVPHRETTVPVVPQRPYPQPARPSSQPAKDHYLPFWQLKMDSECQEGSFSNRFEEPNPLITTGYSKENKGEIHESREDEKHKQKNTSEKSKTPRECSAVTCVYWENACCWRGRGVGGRLTHMSETDHCPLCHRALASAPGNWEMLAFSFIISFLSWAKYYSLGREFYLVLCRIAQERWRQNALSFHRDGWRLRMLQNRGLITSFRLQGPRWVTQMPLCG